MAYGLFAVTRDYWLLLVVWSTLVAVASSLVPQTFAYARQAVERSDSTKGPLAISAVRMVFSVSWVGAMMSGPLVGLLLVTGRARRGAPDGSRPSGS